MTRFDFSVSITTDEQTGRVLSAYFRIRRGNVHESREFSNGAAIADYSKNGELLGVELVAPCKVVIVDKLAANEPESVRSRTKKFIKNAGPRELIAA